MVASLPWLRVSRRQPCVVDFGSESDYSLAVARVAPEKLDISTSLRRPTQSRQQREVVMEKFLGRKFHRLQVIGFAGRSTNNSILVWCVCDCGMAKRTRLHQLISGAIKSCGCFRREFSSITGRNVKHSKCYTPAYGSWVAMRFRCRNPKHIAYPHYGGRGITICERWDDFRNFLSDMGERPVDSSLDRIDSNGNYCPENCRWATNKEQSRNRRDNHVLTFQGRSACLAQWAEDFGLKYSTVKERIKRGWTPAEALNSL